MYQPVIIYSPDGDFIGYSIKDPDAQKLQSTNIWSGNELDALSQRLNALNQQVDLKAHWPHPQDPDVQALLNDDKFEPIEYVETNVVDEDKSNFVWKKRAENNKWVDSDELDEAQSTIVYKVATVPKRPTDQMQRIKKACERVAKVRAGLI